MQISSPAVITQAIPDVGPVSAYGAAEGSKVSKRPKVITAKGRQVSAPRHNLPAERYQEISRNLYTHSPSITFEGVDTPLNWQRSHQLLAKLNPRATFINKGWDHFLTVKIPEIVRSQYVESPDGRIYWGDISIQRPQFSPKTAVVTNQSYMATVFATPYLITQASILEYQRTGNAAVLVKQKALGPQAEPRAIFSVPVSIGCSACHTYGKSGDELMNLLDQVCDADSYFIINGTKVILRMQEQLALKRFLVYYGPELKATKGVQNKKTILQARMTYPTPNGSNVVYMFPNKYGALEVFMYFMGRRYNKKTQQQGEYMTMPLFTLFRLCEFNFNLQQKIEDIKLLVPKEHRRAIETALAPSISASDAISDPARYFIEETQPATMTEGAREHLASEINAYLFSYANKDLSLIERLNMLLVMAARLLLVKIGAAPDDDKNDWGNKRLVTPEDHMDQCLRSIWIHTINEIQADVRQNPSRPTTIVNKFDPSRITKVIQKCFATGRFSPEDSTFVKDAVSQTRKADNPAASEDELKIISTPTKNDTSSDALRRVRQSQIPFICPGHTPEGPKCGLTKSLAALASVSIEREDFQIRRFIRGELGGVNYIQASPNDDSIKVILNGKFLGFAPYQLYPMLLSLRRSATIIAFDVSIAFDKFDRYLYVYSTGSRPIIPLLILDEAGNLIIKEDEWDKDVDYLLSHGRLEFVDVKECDTNCVIAQSIDHITMAHAGKNILKQEIVQLQKELQRMSADFQKVDSEIASLQLKLEQLQAYYNIDYLQKKLIMLQQKFDEQDFSNFKYTYNESLKIMPPQMRIDIGAAKIETLALPQVVEVLAPLVNYQIDPQMISSYLKYNDLLREKREFRQRYINLRLVINEKEQFYYTNYIEVEGQTVLRAKYTHVHPDPAGMLSMSSNLTVRMNNDMGARGTFQAKMNKQAMATWCNPDDDMEKTAKSLVGANSAVVRTGLHKALGLDKLPSGKLAIVAFAPARGRTQEDSCLINATSRKLGKFRSLKSMIIQESLTRRDSASNQTRDKDAYYDQFYLPVHPVTGKPAEGLDEYGFPQLKAYFQPEQIILGIRRVFYNNRDAEGKILTRDVSKKTEVGQQGYVEQIWRVNQSTLDETVIIRLVQYRDIQSGDKLALPHAQKVTVSEAEEGVNLPFFSNGPFKGLAPDMLINIHGIASRMATGMFQEMMLTSLGVELAQEMDGSSFMPLNQEVLQQSMIELGYQRFGMSEMIDGITGQPIQAMVYAAPAMVLALKHQVEDKVQVSTIKSKRDAATGQLKAGRKKKGGLRFGEMERDNVVGQSAPFVLFDLFCLKADQTQALVCLNCGVLATPQVQPSVGSSGVKLSLNSICTSCGNSKGFGNLTVTRTFVDILNILAAGGVRVYLTTAFETVEESG